MLGIELRRLYSIPALALDHNQHDRTLRFQAVSLSDPHSFQNHEKIQDIPPPLAFSIQRIQILDISPLGQRGPCTTHTTARARCGGSLCTPLHRTRFGTMLSTVSSSTETENLNTRELITSASPCVVRQTQCVCDSGGRVSEMIDNPCLKLEPRPTLHCRSVARAKQNSYRESVKRFQAPSGLAV
jgi:hypothetical protein